MTEGLSHKKGAKSTDTGWARHIVENLTIARSLHSELLSPDHFCYRVMVSDGTGDILEQGRYRTV